MDEKYLASELNILTVPKREELKLQLKTTKMGLNGPENTLEVSFLLTRYKAKDLINEIKKKLQELENLPENIFILNEFLKLKLEGRQTYIYVNNERFRSCVYLLLNIPTEDVESLDDVKSIDEADLRLNHDAHGSTNCYIDPKEEFRAHCSNMQAWVENGYNTQILHRSLAFPLLKRLIEVGDPLAKRSYKEEIALRLESNDIVITQYFIENDMLKLLSEAEQKNIIDAMKPGIGKVLLLNYLASKNKEEVNRFDPSTLTLSLDSGRILVTSIHRSKIAYTDYKPARNLEQLERYSRYLYAGSMVDFGIKWGRVKVLFRTSDLKIAKQVFSTSEVMFQIPRGKDPLKLYVESENMAIYISPELMY